MARRFTETVIWKNKRWFRKLSPDYKLAWFYIKDQCNHAGIWEINCLDLVDDIGLEKFDLVDFIKCCNRSFDKITGQPIEKERLRIIEDDNLWLTNFIQFQCQSGDETVNIYGNFPKSAIQKLADYGLVKEGLSKGYIRVSEPLLNPYINLPNPTLTLKGKEERKEEDKEILKKWYNSDEKIKMKLAKAGKQLELQPDYPPENTGGNNADGLQLPVTEQTTASRKKMSGKEFAEYKERLLGPGESTFRDELRQVKKMNSDQELEKWVNYFSLKIALKDQTNKDYPQFKEHFVNWFLPWDTSKPPPVNLNGNHKETRSKAINPKEIESRYAKVKN